MGKICQDCGASMAENARACPRCGESFTSKQQTRTTSLRLSQNIAGMLCYITFVPAILFLVLDPYDKNRFVRFHAFQSIFLAVAAFVVDWILKIAFSILSVFALMLIPLIGLIGLLYLVLTFVCLIKAYNNEKFEIPVIGSLAKQQAESV